jgi:WD40 repeat protein
LPQRCGDHPARDDRVGVDEQQALAPRGPAAGISGGGDLPAVDAHHGRVVLAGAVRFSDLSFARGGKCIVAGGSDTVNCHGIVLCAWDVDSGEKRYSVRCDSNFSFGLSFTRDGSVAAANLGDEIRLWDTVTGQEVGEPLPWRGLTGRPALFPAARAVAAGDGERAVIVLDRMTGRQLHRLEGHRDTVWTTVISRDGRLLATTIEDLNQERSEVRIWDTTSGKELHRLDHPKRGASGLAFSPDGKTLATGGADGAIRLWDTRTGRLVHSFQAPRSIWCLTFSPDGRRLASGGSDTAALVWELPPER